MSLTLDEARALHDEVCVLDLHADTAKLNTDFSTMVNSMLRSQAGG